MQIAQILAGYSLGGADLLRRAMGKKKPEEMAEQRGVFLKGATERGVEPARANHIFDQMETFAGYGFNKSHAAAYALIAYQTAWLKTHYPEAYMAAVLTADIDNTDRLVVLKDELQAAWASCSSRPTSTLRCCAFTVAGPKRISYGLGALKGVGPSAVDAIVDRARRARAVHEPHRSLPARGSHEDQSARARGARAVGRARLRSVRIARRSMQGIRERAASGRTLGARAGGGADGAVRRRRARRHARARADAGARVEQARAPRRRAREPRAVFDGPSVRRLRRALQALHERRDREGAAGACRARRCRITFARKRFSPASSSTCGGAAIASRSCSTTTRSASRSRCSTRCSRKRSTCIAKHAVLIAEGQLRYDDFINGWRLTAKRVRSADEAIEEYARRLTIRWPSDGAGRVRARAAAHLEAVHARPLRGLDRVSHERRRGALTLGEAWSVRVTRELRDQLTRLLGDDSFLIHYPKHFV